MKRTTIRYKAAQTKKREAGAKKLSVFLENLRSEGQRDEQTAIELGTSRDTIYAWRNKLRFPREIVIRGIEARYGLKIL